jgi:CBS domain-containing protein
MALLASDVSRVVVVDPATNRVVHVLSRMGMAELLVEHPECWTHEAGLTFRHAAAAGAAAAPPTTTTTTTMTTTTTTTTTATTTTATTTTARTPRATTASHRVVVTVPSDMPAVDAFHQLQRDDLSGIAVVADDGSLVADLSASDLKSVRWVE